MAGKLKGNFYKGIRKRSRKFTKPTLECQIKGGRFLIIGWARNFPDI